MQKARLYIDDNERHYVDKYKERDDITRMKLLKRNIPAEVVNEFIQLRYDNLFLRRQLEEKKARLTAIGVNPFADST